MGKEKESLNPLFHHSFIPAIQSVFLRNLRNLWIKRFGFLAFNKKAV